MFRVSADPPLDGAPATARGLIVGLGLTRQHLRRLMVGLPVYVDTLGDQLALQALGLQMEPVAALPPTVPPAASARRLRARLEKVVGPPSTDGFRPPASTEDVEIIESQLGLSLPADYLGWLGVTGGLDFSAAPSPFGPWTLTDLCGALASWQMRQELDFELDWWQPSWLDVAENGGGDALCLDLAAGGLLEFCHDHEARPTLAATFSDWLSDWIASIERGERVILEHNGRFDGVVHRDALTGTAADVCVRGESTAERQSRIQTEILDNPQTLALKLLPALQRSGVVELVPGAFPPLHVLPAMVRGLQIPNPAWGLARELRACDDVVSVGQPSAIQQAIEAFERCLR